MRCADRQDVGPQQLPLSLLNRVLRERGSVAEAGEALAVLALARQGLLVLHAAAFRVNGRGDHGCRGVLILGPTGRGKSTLCAAALRAGGQVLGDDLIGLLANRNRPRVVPFRRYLSFRDTVPGLDGLTPSGDAEGEARWVLTPAAAPAAFVPYLSPDAIWCLEERSMDAVSRLTGMAPSVGLAWLVRAGSPLVFSSDSPARDVAAGLAAATLERLPVRGLAAGRDILDEPASTLARLLDESV